MNIVYFCFTIVLSNMEQVFYFNFLCICWFVKHTESHIDFTYISGPLKHWFVSFQYFYIYMFVFVIVYLASQDALEVMLVWEWLSDRLYWLDWCDPGEQGYLQKF